MATLVWVYTLLFSLILKRMCAANVLNMKIQQSTMNLSPVTHKAKTEVLEEELVANVESLNFKIDNKNSSYQQCLHISTSSSTTAEDALLLKKLCIIKNNWYYEMPGTYFGPVNFTKNRRQYWPGDLRKNAEAREMSKSDYKNYDCLYQQRQHIRPYPGDCYGKKFGMNWMMWRFFWAEVYGDVMYAFDFILYNKSNPGRKENQFWYLILYLKTLATLIENPVEMAEYDIKLKALELKAHELETLAKTKFFGLFASKNDDAETDNSKTIKKGISKTDKGKGRYQPGKG